jgi:hypothetical protein
MTQEADRQWPKGEYFEDADGWPFFWMAEDGMIEAIWPDQPRPKDVMIDVMAITRQMIDG